MGRRKVREVQGRVFVWLFVALALIVLGVGVHPLIAPKGGRGKLSGEKTRSEPFSLRHLPRPIAPLLGSFVRGLRPFYTRTSTSYHLPEVSCYYCRYYFPTIEILLDSKIRHGKALKLKVICSWYENEDYGFAQFLGFKGSIHKGLGEGEEIHSFNFNNFEDLQVTRYYHYHYCHPEKERKVHRKAVATAKAMWKAEVPQGIYSIFIKGYIQHPKEQTEIWGKGFERFYVDASPPSVYVMMRDASLKIGLAGIYFFRLRIDGKEEFSGFWSWKGYEWTPPSSRWFFEPHEIEVESVDWVGNRAKVGVSPTVFDPYSEEEKMSGVTLSYTIPYDGKVNVEVWDYKTREVRKLIKGEFRKAGAHKEYWDGMIDDPNILYPSEDNIGAVDGLYYLVVRAYFDNGGNWEAMVAVRVWVDRPGVE